MVTNRDSKSFESRQKFPKVAQMTGTVDVFDLCSGILGPTLWRASTCPILLEWLTQPRSRELPSCSAIDLGEIWRSSNISLWIWSIFSRVGTVLGCPGWGSSQVEKSRRLNWATRFLMVTYDGACSPNVFIRMVNTGHCWDKGWSMF